MTDSISPFMKQQVIFAAPNISRITKDIKSDKEYKKQKVHSCCKIKFQRQKSLQSAHAVCKCVLANSTLWLSLKNTLLNIIFK